MYIFSQRPNKHIKCQVPPLFPSTYRPEERLLDLFGKDVEHVNRLRCQRQIGARNTLILSQLGLAALLLLLKGKHTSCSTVSTVIPEKCTSFFCCNS